MQTLPNSELVILLVQLGRKEVQVVILSEGRSQSEESLFREREGAELRLSMTNLQGISAELY